MYTKDMVESLKNILELAIEQYDKISKQFSEEIESACKHIQEMDKEINQKENDYNKTASRLLNFIIAKRGDVLTNNYNYFELRILEDVRLLYKYFYKENSEKKLNSHIKFCETVILEQIVQLKQMLSVEELVSYTICKMIRALSCFINNTNNYERQDMHLQHLQQALYEFSIVKEK